MTEELCNCDAQLPTWAQDKGVITATDLLPISAVMYGPLSFDIENANFTIGPLRCSGESIQNSLPSQPSHKDIKIIFRTICSRGKNCELQLSQEIWIH